MYVCNENNEKKLVQKFWNCKEDETLDEDKLYKKVEDLESKISQLESRLAKAGYNEFRRKFSSLAHNKLEKIDDLLCEANYANPQSTKRLYQKVNNLILEVEVSIKYYRDVIDQNHFDLNNNSRKIA